MLVYVLCSSLLAIPQFFLCKMRSKLWGLILPILGLLVSLVFLCSTSVNRKGDYESYSYNDAGAIVIQDKVQIETAPVSNFIVIEMLINFIIMNASTVIILLEYIIVRGKIKTNREMNKIASYGL